MVTAIIALARSLGIRVIAEGVEDLRQMQVLNQLGCHIMQGFLFSKAQPAEQVELWLNQTVRTHAAPWMGRCDASAETAATPVAPSASGSPTRLTVARGPRVAVPRT